jgi:hypothetical protein
MPKAQLRLMLKDLPSCPKSYWNHPSKKAEKMSSAFEKKQAGCGLLTKKVAKKQKVFVKVFQKIPQTRQYFRGLAFIPFLGENGRTRRSDTRVENFERKPRFSR